MAVDPLSALRAYQQAANTARGGSAGGAAGGADAAMDFGALVQEAVRQAAQSATVAEQQSLPVAAGQADIVDVVTAIAAAETQLQTVVAVRDQVIQAYQEILRMPI
jgi:flagellar hook-basal body complex protein FliE